MGWVAKNIGEFVSEHFTDNPYVLVGVMILAAYFAYSLTQADTVSELMGIIFKWIFFPFTIILFLEEKFDDISKNSEKKEPPPPKKPLNQIQKISIVSMVIGVATWFANYGYNPNGSIIGFVIFFGSIATYFAFKE